MKAKEKAIELVNKYSTYVVMWSGGIEVERENVKQCALIAVEELTEGIRSYDVFLHHKSAKDFMKLNSTIETNLLSYLNYLEEVKQEIKKL
jgi:hypothetical protein